MKSGFSYQRGTLHCEGVSVQQLVKRFGTPLYLYSENHFLSSVREFKKGLKGIRHLICFAVKSNSNLSVLRLLTGAGCGMDVVSGASSTVRSGRESRLKKLFFQA